MESPFGLSCSEFTSEQLLSSGLSHKLIKHLLARGLVLDDAEGTKFVYMKPDGENNGFSRVRLKEPTSRMKYTQEAGTGCHLYFASAATNPATLQSALPVFITEGEKKALALHDRFDTLPGNDRCVIGLGGVWNWVGEKSDVLFEGQGKHLLREFENVRLWGRSVYIVFDSDIEENEQVRRAEQQLAENLRRMGAVVKLLTLDREHKGIDDWLIAWGSNWKDELRQLCRDGLERRSGTHHAAMYKQVYSFQDMLESKFPVPQFFLGDYNMGLVGQGMITLIHGPTNLGKTYFSTQMAYCIATGRPFLGLPSRKAKVLVLQGELPPGMFANSRLKPIVVAGYEISEGLFFLNFPWDLAESSKYKETFSDGAWRGFTELIKLVDRYEPEVIVIDPLQSYNNLVESSNDQNREFMKRLKKVAVEYNLAIVAVDHDKKDTEGGVSDIRGASAKSDLVDTVLGLRPVEGKQEISFHYDKVRYINKAKPGPTLIQLNSPFFSVVGYS